MQTLNEQVRSYWEDEPCGTADFIVGDRQPFTHAWFEQIERERYEREPEIHALAQFTRYSGSKVLEIGVGAGTDHLQWARAGCDCHGVDLTDAAIEVTRARLAHYGLASQLRRCDAENLPFDDESFDVVYSWGVIHHSERPERIVAEIHRVLRPGGEFLGMVYGRHSPLALKVWVGRALLRGRPWQSLSRVIAEHVESVGTRAYTPREVQRLCGSFASVVVRPVITYYDRLRWPAAVAGLVPDRFGWFITVRARKDG